MATAPLPGTSRRAAADEVTLTVKVDGTPHTFRPTEMTARLVGDLRRATGMGVNGLMQLAIGDDPDIDILAAIVWMARRQAGEAVTYETVADSITYDSDLEPVDEVADEDPDSPPL